MALFLPPWQKVYQVILTHYSMTSLFSSPLLHSVSTYVNLCTARGPNRLPITDYL